MATSIAIPPMRILKFVSLTCSACAAMAKARTMERFKEKHPEVKIIELCVSDETGDSPEGTEYAKAFALSDDYEVEGVPTLVFEVKGHGEVYRIAGAANLSQLEEGYEEATEEWEELHEREASIPW